MHSESGDTVEGVEVEAGMLEMLRAKFDKGQTVQVRLSGDTIIVLLL
jgi:hypothetical protein